MNDEQENQLGSYRTTGQVLTDYADTFAGVKALQIQHTNLLDSIRLIDILAQAQAADTRGVTLDKRELERQMREFTLRVAGAVGAYASVGNNQTLKTKVAVNESDFTRARDDQRDDIAQGVHDDAQAVLNQLADYGITQDTLNGLKTRIDAYRLAIASPSVARANRRNATQLLEEEFKRARMICKERLDGLLLQFKESNPEFYNKYRAAREIIDTGHRKKAPATPEQPPPGP